MKKIWILSLGLLLCAPHVFAADRAAEILRGMASHVRSLGVYGVTFSVATGDGGAQGRCVVDGDRYYLTMGDAEIYCDGKTRYEVNNRAREITADAVDATSRNILNNPTRAFDLAGEEFVAELLWERDGRAAVRLTPQGGQSAMSSMTVTVDTQPMTPLALEYDFDGDRIAVSVEHLAAQTAAPKAFRRADYASYEFIDFR